MRAPEREMGTPCALRNTSASPSRVMLSARISSLYVETGFVCVYPTVGGDKALELAHRALEGML
jgi:hypothetical protein